VTARADDRIRHLIDETQQYLRGQKDLFGNIIYREEDEERMARQKAARGVVTQSPDEPWAGSPTLEALDAKIRDCMKCPLGETRTKFVFGTGNPSSQVMFIGEAPGADEDAQGEPFVGRAGQLLTKIIESLQMQRSDVYICNIIKCRPPNNRAPLPIESETCTPYLMKQIELVKPRFIICLGRTAAQWLLKTNDNLATMRGKIHDYNGIKLIVTYHPAALLRNPDWKRPTWEDMKMFKKAFDEPVDGKHHDRP
jgi:uracil-DNA glycosylase family 4